MHGTEQPGERLRLSDLLAALSVVTDLGHGQPPDDAMRACLLSTRLAEVILLMILAVSFISTIKVDSPSARRSLAPMRVKSWSKTPITQYAIFPMARAS